MNKEEFNKHCVDIMLSDSLKNDTPYRRMLSNVKNFNPHDNDDDLIKSVEKRSKSLKQNILLSIETSIMESLREFIISNKNKPINIKTKRNKSCSKN